MADEKTHNEVGEQAPSTVDKQAPDVAEDNAPATSEPTATSIPTANAPDPEAVGEDNPNAAKPKVESGAKERTVAKKPPQKATADDTVEDEPTPKKAPKAAAGDAESGQPAPKAKKEKAPALEDKPFAEFIQQHYLPALKEGLAKQGVEAVDLIFEQRKIMITGYAQEPECWQIIGQWNSGYKQTKAFNLYFFKEDIQGPKGFSYAESGGKPSTLESFLIDERKVNLGLLVFGVLQRLNAQKWLVRN